MSERPELHLTGIALEALAVNDNTDFNAAAHLQTCAQCRAALAAMREENRLFAAELAHSIQEPSMIATTAMGVTKSTPRPRQSHQPLVFYAAAASVMLVAALAMIYFGKQSPKPGAPKDTVAEAVKTPPEKTGDDKTKPAEKTPAEESVFEGTTAANWEAQLEKEIANTKDGQLSKLATKCIHALSVLGRDALPQVIQLMRSPDESCNDAAMAIIQNVQFEKDELPRMSEFLKSDDYATRKAGVKILEMLALNSPKLDTDVRALLLPALKDRDKAVVEVARLAIDGIDARLRAAEAEKTQDVERAKLLAAANEALKAQRYNEALVLGMKAKNLKSDAASEQLLTSISELKIKEEIASEERAKLVRDEKRKRDQFQKLIETGRAALQNGDNEKCIKAAEDARALFPADAAANDLLQSAKLQKAKFATERAAYGGATTVPPPPANKGMVGEQNNE